MSWQNSGMSHAGQFSGSGNFSGSGSMSRPDQFSSSGPMFYPGYFSAPSYAYASRPTVIIDLRPTPPSKPLCQICNRIAYFDSRRGEWLPGCQDHVNTALGRGFHKPRNF